MCVCHCIESDDDTTVLDTCETTLDTDGDDCDQQQGRLEPVSQVVSAGPPSRFDLEDFNSAMQACFDPLMQKF